MSLLIFLLIVVVTHGTGELIIIIENFRGFEFSKKMFIFEVESETRLNRRVEEMSKLAFHRRILLPRFQRSTIWVSPMPTTTYHSSCLPVVRAVVNGLRLFQCMMNLTDVRVEWINDRVLAF